MSDKRDEIVKADEDLYWEDDDDDGVIDVEAEEVEADDLPVSLGYSPTPALPDPDGPVETKTDMVRLDATRLGTEMVAPERGLVTSLRMLGSGCVEFELDGGRVAYVRPMDELVEVRVPVWRPGELLDEITGVRALGRVNRELREVLEAALS